HMAWFTQGEKRSGIFYAWSDDQGKTFSNPMQVGDQDKLPGRADVLALDKQVALAWKVFDGTQTRVEAMYSTDGGLRWSKPQVVAETATQSAHPALITDGKQIFLSWNSIDTGFRLIPIRQSDDDSNQ
ncbi:MAG: sialidase family protein, partial [Methylococcales bacterium]|nr:sialidase family protein [Methylococcales bacterium]